MFDIQRLIELDVEVYKQIQGIKEKREKETKTFIEGMEKGAELLFKAIREELRRSDNNAK
jgi:hypothetical protein